MLYAALYFLKCFIQISLYLCMHWIHSLGERRVKATSMRISGDTHKSVIKTRGIFEQLYKQRLSLDDTVYLSSRLISFIYQTFQRFAVRNQIEIVKDEDCFLTLDNVENLNELVPEIISEITEINHILAEKEQKSSRLNVVTRRRLKK
jgi:hypothetical protein